MNFVTPDHRRRITLPPSFKPGELLALEEVGDGTYKLVPMTAIPNNQLWAWTPESLGRTETALKGYHQGGFVEADSAEGRDFLSNLEQE
ncbi:MAG: hypothetical protein P4L36_04865 [Holophaga sp.]|nr:hypothetical protein [Holophaga sp.]